MNYKRCFMMVLFVGLLLSGCSTSDTTKTEAVTQTEDKSTLDIFKDNDYDTEYSEEDATKINLDAMTQDVTIDKAGTYVLEGTLDGYSVIVNANDQDVVRIVLKNANIQSSTTAPIYVKQAKKVILSLPKGTKNTVTDITTYTVDEKEEPSAAIFSKDDLTINGSGSLTVKASYRNGIQSKDKLKLMGGTYTITAANDALKGKDALYIHDGSYTLSAKGDGMVTTNAEEGAMIVEDGNFHITAQQDGIQSETTLRILNGTFTITAGGGSVNEVKGTSQPWGEFGDHDETDKKSTKGIKSNGKMTLENGSFTISSSDDALHSNDTIKVSNGIYQIQSDDDGIHADQKLTISGGTIDIARSYEGLEAVSIQITDGTIHLVSSDDGINAAGESGAALLKITGGYIYVDAYGDGVDSNQDILMEDGTLIVMGPTSGGNGALDYDGTFNMNDGTLVAAGSSGMAMAPSTSSKQPSIMVNLSDTQVANQALSIHNEAGEVLLGCAPSKSYQSIIFSSPLLEANNSYQVMSGSTPKTVKDTLFTKASGGSLLTTMKLNDTISTYGSAGMQPMQGGGGRRP